MLATFALFIIAVLFFLFAISLFVPIYGEICAKDEYTNTKECTPYHIALVALWHILKATNDWSAAITALATLAIGAFTLQLKRSTDKLFDAGEKQRIVSEAANAIARETGHAQVRAYLTCSAAKYRIYGTTIFIDIALTNVGQSPARSVSVSGKLHLADLKTLEDQIIFDGKFTPKFHIRSFENGVARFQAIHAGATLTENISFMWPISFDNGEGLTDSQTEAFFGWNAITFFAEVRWIDVFGNVETFPVFITNECLEVEQMEKTERPDSGVLNVYMKDKSKDSEEE